VTIFLRENQKLIDIERKKIERSQSNYRNPARFCIQKFNKRRFMMKALFWSRGRVWRGESLSPFNAKPNGRLNLILNLTPVILVSKDGRRDEGLSRLSDL
jgi:hypothetical protein